MYKIMIGILIGALLNQVGTALGEQRYSDSIKYCVQAFGANK